MHFEVRETQSGLGTSRTGYPVGLGTQSDWVPSHPVGDWNWCIPTRGASLDEIIFEAQKVKEILYRRNKEGNRLHMYFDEEINASFNKCKESLPSETRQMQVEVDKVDLQLATMEEQTQQQINDSFKRTKNPSKDEEYVSDSFWPERTESWHIHEVKSQREAFTRTVPQD